MHIGGRGLRGDTYGAREHTTGAARGYERRSQGWVWGDHLSLLLYFLQIVLRFLSDLHTPRGRHLLGLRLTCA